MLAISLIVLGFLSRLIIHLPNFTPVLSIALFSGVYLKSKKQAFLTPLFLLAISDIVIGFHHTMIYTWASVVLISGLGLWLKQNKSLTNILGVSLASSILFFVVSNLGVWLVGGLYPLTLAGLVNCFVLAVPFFAGTLISTIVYSFILFGLYEVIATRLQTAKSAVL